MVAIIRRLGNFTKSFHALNLSLTLKSLSTKVSTQELSELQSVVQEFNNSCEDDKFRHKKHLYARHVRRLANANQSAMIEQSLEHQKKYPNIRREGFAIRLISLYGESGMFQHARKVFDEMPALGCPRTIKSFSALLKSAINAKEFHRVVELFEDLPSAISIQPDLFCHSMLIQALCEIGSVNEALSKLRELGNKADTVAHNTLLSALYKTGRFSEAEGLWAEMEESRTARGYNIRIKAMFFNKRVDEAVGLAGEMANKGIEYDKYTYNHLIIGLCENGNLKEAKKWYNELRKSKCCPPLVSTYSVLVPACCEAGDFDKAFEICSDAVKHKIFLISTLSEQVIDGLVENGRTEKALELKKLLTRLEE